MSLYAVQVLTGQEAEVCRRLADRRIATLCCAASASWTLWL